MTVMFGALGFVPLSGSPGAFGFVPSFGSVGEGIVLALEGAASTCTSARAIWLTLEPASEAIPVEGTYETLALVCAETFFAQQQNINTAVSAKTIFFD